MKRGRRLIHLPSVASMLKRFLAPVMAIALLVAFAPCVAAVPDEDGAYDTWAWFKDTYWIVPQDGIYSVTHDADKGEFGIIRGQTVFHITDYFNGYWTGSVVVKVTGLQFPTCQTVLGQTTPEGEVYMTMYDIDSGLVRNNPLGNMVMVDGEWTMVNMMTSTTGRKDENTMSHWAYMIQSEKGDATFNRLPFARESIPDFMSSCPPGPMITRPWSR